MNFLKKLFAKKSSKESNIEHISTSITNNENIDEIPYGINIEDAHEVAKELIPEDFFWDPINDLAPFGSDEGDTALHEFRTWRKSNRFVDIYYCLQWTIESVGEMSISSYNKTILNEQLITSLLSNDDYDHNQYIFTLDISIIATGFGQLVDEGKIDKKGIGLIEIAIERQKLYSKLRKEWDYSSEYITNLNILTRALNELKTSYNKL